MYLNLIRAESEHCRHRQMFRKVALCMASIQRSWDQGGQEAYPSRIALWAIILRAPKEISTSQLCRHRQSMMHFKQNSIKTETIQCQWCQLSFFIISIICAKIDVQMWFLVSLNKSHVISYLSFHILFAFLKCKTRFSWSLCLFFSKKYKSKFEWYKTAICHFSVDTIYE